MALLRVIVSEGRSPVPEGLDKVKLDIPDIKSMARKSLF
jgi:hypothetical protein